MALHVPPVTDETDAIAAFLAQQQDAFRALLFGLTPAQAAAAPSASSPEHRRPGPPRDARPARAGSTAPRRPPACPSRRGGVDAYLDGFRFDADGSLDDLLADFDEVSAAVLDAVRRLDLDTPVPVPDAPWFPQDVEAWSVRWVWWHLMEELARHAGHGDIVRETLDGATMYALVAARDGLPDLPFLKAWKPADGGLRMTDGRLDHRSSTTSWTSTGGTPSGRASRGSATRSTSGSRSPTAGACVRARRRAPATPAGGGDLVLDYASPEPSRLRSPPSPGGSATSWSSCLAHAHREPLRRTARHP